MQLLFEVILCQNNTHVVSRRTSVCSTKILNAQHFFKFEQRRL